LNFYKTYYTQIWLLILPFFILIILRVLGFDGMVGQDSYSYVDYAKSIKNGIEMSVHPGNFLWAQGYPLLGALFSYIGVSVASSMQLISCFALSVSLIIVFKILKEIYPESSKKNMLIYLTLFGILCPYYLRNGMLTMSDVVAACLIITSIYYGYCYSKKHQIKHLLVCVIAMSYSLFVRYPSAVVILPISIYIIVVWLKSIQKITHFAILIIPGGIYLLHVFFAKKSINFLSHGALDFWSVQNYFTSTFYTDQGTLSFTFPNIIFIFEPLAHYGFLLLGLPFLFFLIKHKKINNTLIYVIVVSCLSYMFFVGGITTQNHRHLLLIYPLILVLCYYGYEKMYQLEIIANYKKALISIGVIIQIALCILAFKTIFLRNQLEKSIAQELTKYENNTLYSFDIDIALKSRETNFKHLNFWNKEYSTFEKGSLILFNEERFKTQWKDRNPMINWTNLKKDYHLIKLEGYESKWNLYRIE
jgi:hypothetical protein